MSLAGTIAGAMNLASCVLGHPAVHRLDGSSDGSSFDAAETAPDVCVPVREICDGRDNDCDGVVDNDDPGGGDPCATGMNGICATGHIHCLGALETCVADRTATDESCNGVDDDCDGMIDDGDPGGGASCTSSMPGACAPGHVHCVAGAVVCVADATPAAERCDGADNDCDGAADNGFACALGSGTSACATSCGSTGTHACSPACTFTACAPPAEACDLVDEDCDGRCDPPACRQLVYQLVWTDGVANTDRAYSTNPAEFAAFGYRNEGAVFWTYAVAVPGSLPLYRCFHPTVMRHFVGYGGCLGVPGAGADLLLGYVIGSGACGGAPMYQYYCGASGFVATIDPAAASALTTAGCTGALLGVDAWGAP
jgi:hypothetical protein